jgi:hypothetical protein
LHVTGFPRRTNAIDLQRLLSVFIRGNENGE